MTKPSRRSAIAQIVSASAALAGSGLDVLAAQQPCADGAAAGTLIGTLPLSRPEGVVQPYGVKFGGPGLDARQITDLSRLDPDRLITPNDAVFVRTERPSAAARQSRSWRIATTGLLAREGSLTIAELTRMSRPMGTHLVECAGNNNPANFGLMSVAAWDGVPLADLLPRLQPTAHATAVLVTGLDDEAPSAASVAGAGWVLPLATLDRLGAFLALRMNGQPLPPDHGMPVRLAVPGWYGCAWIKWVTGIRLVGAEEPATSQMKEFAGRTHQTARHDLAKDYAAPDVQAAAMPVRVEQRRTADGLSYRIVGIAWGGDRPADRLEIRFGTDDAWRPVAMCPPRPKVPEPRAPSPEPRVWTLWEYRWRPPAAGVYNISLRLPDPSIPQRRLASGYYVRQVAIEQI